MSTEQNKELVKRFVQDVKNRKDPAASQEIFSMEYEHHFHMPGEVIPPGYVGAGRVGEIFGEAFPEIKVTVDTLIAEGEYVLERSTVEALHGGQFYGTPATNKTVTWTENHLISHC